MRYQGKISGWKDDQGFGFVCPKGGDQKAFVHIKAFLKYSSRPVDGDLITYELAKDEKNRYYAKNIQFVGETSSSTDYKKLSFLTTYFGLLFLALLLLFSINKHISLNIFVYYILASVVTFFIYAMDKIASKNSSHRTSEKTLHMLSFAGGWPGAIIAQKLLSHKSKKETFQNAFWITALLNLLTIAWLLLSENAQQYWSQLFR